MNKIYKFGTGQEVPEGSKYLWSYREVDTMAPKGYWIWHYFLVTVREPGVQPIKPAPFRSCRCAKFSHDGHDDGCECMPDICEYDCVNKNV